MKKYFMLFLVILLSCAVVAQEYEITGYVNDYAGILSAQVESELSSLGKELQDSGKAEYAIVTVSSLEGQDIASFSYNLGEGVLGDPEKNNGLLLVVSMDDRRWDIEVGRGLEPIIPDIIAGRIARSYLIPNFQDGNYEKGILETSYALKAVLDENLESEYYPSTDPMKEFLLALIPLFILMVFVGFMVALFTIAFKKEFDKKKKDHKDDDDFFIAALVLGSMMRNSRRGKGGFSGGFSGGGFGGFSGGSFGGGGARGGW